MWDIVWHTKRVNTCLVQNIVFANCWYVRTDVGSTFILAFCLTHSSGTSHRRASSDCDSGRSFQCLNSSPAIFRMMCGVYWYLTMCRPADRKGWPVQSLLLLHKWQTYLLLSSRYRCDHELSSGAPTYGYSVWCLYATIGWFD